MLLSTLNTQNNLTSNGNELMIALLTVIGLLLGNILLSVFNLIIKDCSIPVTN